MHKMLGSIINKFDAEAKNHMERQSLNPFSGAFENRSPSPRLSKDQYGKPLAGSKTEERGQKAKCHILREILDLCTCIHDVGMYNKQHKQHDDSDDEDINDDEIIVTFGEIFQIYTKINDKVVGLLIAAKKRGFLFFDKEILFQRRDDNVLIALIKPIKEIVAIINKELKVNSSPVSPQPNEASHGVAETNGEKQPSKLVVNGNVENVAGKEAGSSTSSSPTQMANVSSPVPELMIANGEVKNEATDAKNSVNAMTNGICEVTNEKASDTKELIQENPINNIVETSNIPVANETSNAAIKNEVPTKEKDEINTAIVEPTKQEEANCIIENGSIENGHIEGNAAMEQNTSDNNSDLSKSQISEEQAIVEQTHNSDQSNRTVKDIEQNANVELKDETTIVPTKEESEPKENLEIVSLPNCDASQADIPTIEISEAPEVEPEEDDQELSSNDTKNVPKEAKVTESSSEDNSEKNNLVEDSNDDKDKPLQSSEEGKSKEAAIPTSENKPTEVENVVPTNNEVEVSNESTVNDTGNEDIPSENKHQEIKDLALTKEIPETHSVNDVTGQAAIPDADNQKESTLSKEELLESLTAALAVRSSSPDPCDEEVEHILQSQTTVSSLLIETNQEVTAVQVSSSEINSASA